LSQPHNVTLPGILLCLSAFLLFSTADAMARLLMQSNISLSQVLVLIMLIALVPVFSLITYERSWHKLRPSHPALIAVTVGICCLEAFAAFYAFSHLNYLVEAYALFFTMPLWTALLAALVLKEHLSRLQLAAILMGFAGVLIANWPQDGTTALGWGHVAGLAAPLLGSIRILATRKLGQHDGGLGMLVYMFGGLGLLNAVAVESFAPLTSQMLAVAVFGGLAQGLAHCCFMLAARKTPAPLLAPFQYSQVLWALIFGVLIFREWPHASIYPGLALIVAGGLILIRKKREA